jgi:hypothetical protein
MEHQLWKAIVALLAPHGKPRFDPGEDYTDHDIVGVWYWSVIHDRPLSWAVQPRHWPPHLRRGRRFPSNATLSRRLRTPAVRELLAWLEARVIAPADDTARLFWMLDGKPLPIGGCSKDRHAGYGRAASGKAKGYKTHAIIGADGVVAAWRRAPMNKDERVMAARLLGARPPIQGYLVADSNYDSNKLHEVCAALGELQLVTRRRYGPGHGTGHRKQSAGRLRSKDLLENPNPRFGEGLLQARSEIERQYGNLTNWGGGLTCLPAWVRTYPRVQRRVQAKLVLTALKRQLPERTCVA